MTTTLNVACWFPRMKNQKLRQRPLDGVGGNVSLSMAVTSPAEWAACESRNKNVPVERDLCKESNPLIEQSSGLVVSKTWGRVKLINQYLICELNGVKIK